ncbi:threonine--tRNA ligase [Candidatus Woesebacteria bacterium]|nr:threonine--tRNA ligase [Candidatus Woesebacteria bacterium]
MSKDRSNLDNLRHSASHLLAAAVLQMWPDAKPTLGPPIENGFYYDFDFGKAKITEEDLPKIEEKMHEIAESWKGFEEEKVTAEKAKEYFKDNTYKTEMIKELADKKKDITFYKSGDFIDLCGGGHIDDPKDKLKHFKLLSIAGAYWRGDEKNKMLTRIYGTIFPAEKELSEYLENLEEAEKYNHRTLGKEMELFAIFPEIGPGLPVWLPKGYAMRRVLEDYMIKLERGFGYEHILSPHINKEDLFKTSGHLGFYDESMYAPIEIEDQKYYLKPMNCPAGMTVYKMKTRSYRDLPIKLGEFGTVYRFEKTGELHGLQRVRGFTQNDAHIFCTKEQLVDQIQEVIDMMLIFYKDLGFKKYKFVLALSDPEKEKYKFCGSREGWDWAENTLREVLKNNNLEFTEKVGDAAFYGPKIDVLAENVYGKSDAISTVQIDFNLPERFDLSFVNEKGENERPYVIHRALVGSFERFFAFLIEYYKGSFPVWFAPVQAKILPITDRNLKYAKGIMSELKDQDIRVELDDRSETLGNKIRQAQEEKVPYMLIVGDKEASSPEGFKPGGKNLVSVRLRSEKNLGQMDFGEFIDNLKKKVNEKSVDL